MRIVADDVNAAAGRAYHSIVDDGRAYRSITEIATSAMLQLSLHKSALGLIAFENRYRDIAGVCTLVNVARSRLEQTIAEMGQQAAVEAPRRRRAA